MSAELLALPLILWEFTYRPTSEMWTSLSRRAASEQAAREFCDFFGHEYEGGAWIVIEGEP